MNFKVVVTADGSRTLSADDTGSEIYHSRHGALQESRYVFIRQGLDFFGSQAPKADPLFILEIGFGTGLNAILAMQWAQLHKYDVRYVGLEPNRVEINLLHELDYPTLLDVSKHDFVDLHTENGLSRPFFEAKIITNKLEDYSLPQPVFDLCWFDAFSPRFQPDIWQEENFKKVYELLKPGGRMVTYSAKGEVQRALKSTGFTVEKLPGPPGKREMLRATRPA